MARSPKKVQLPASLARQLATLTRRVKALERWVADEDAYREEYSAKAEERHARNSELEAEWNRRWEALKAKSEAREARGKVVNEFYREYIHSRLLAVHPDIEESNRQRRRQLNEFLVARGMEPDPEPSPE